MDVTIKTLLDDKETYANKKITISGWIRNNRAQKDFGFIDLNDGTCFATLQIVYESEKTENFRDVQKFRVGASVKVTGLLVLTPRMKQPCEIKATSVTLIGDSPNDYPIQPKRHTREFLRQNAHLRMRTNLFSAVFRVRSVISHAIHDFFHKRGFVYVHTPIITGADAEGAGEMFNVTAFGLNDVPNDDAGDVDYSQDFFGKQTNLTVSGQLQAEAYALAFRNVYTFGPTFRAEKSNTQRHASEFWMIEPEIAFADLNDDMALAEDMVKHIIDRVFQECPDELTLFNKFVEKGLREKLQKVKDSHFLTMTHKEAIDVLREHADQFENEPMHGHDLATEHEKFLTAHVGGPVFVTDWPKDIKAFYMRLNDDEETVAAMDLLVPGAGELIGGSQREERMDILKKRMDEMHVDSKQLWWYEELRKYGGCKHAGYGLGLERMVMYVTGVDNIRDVIPFPRTPKHCEF